jgi:hypothetical protein
MIAVTNDPAGLVTTTDLLEHRTCPSLVTSDDHERSEG